ncbi:Rieske 2Fe-2S domain-containing protein [Neptunomonas phycophila]|uniref:Rieske 2Fe-2S domain-containing protein n=1 Tax=Neptunomonas phycophila TaxID=1572645 RepID=A0ABT9ET29_9GAMM|nr:Rieske 2Fe-2S domain-containing protein [Neptunomonas phycophila]MDO6468207.1 Rieske 2Fe-2S domain-containing protein [Neptunomonas phycophila]MDP2522216.1 Rieske 2Fe-2S domain-containing protein [Neptunomonas phycophila]
MSPICPINDITDPGAKGILHNGVSFMVIKKNDQFYVYENSCPHQRIALEWQPDQFLDIDKQFIQCAMHGALFTIETGQCIAGPCPGKSLIQVPHQIIDNTLYLP